MHILPKNDKLWLTTIWGYNDNGTGVGLYTVSSAIPFQGETERKLFMETAR